MWREFLDTLAKDNRRAYLVALRVTGNSASAEEAVQDAFVQILRSPPEFQGQAQAHSYLLRTVYGVAKNSVRSQWRRQAHETEKALPERREALPPDTCARNEMADAAREELQRLPEKYRVSLCLCCEQGLSQKAASEVMQVPERTLSGYVQTGLQRLRNQLAQRGFAAVAPLLISESLRVPGLPAIPGLLASDGTSPPAVRQDRANSGASRVRIWRTPVTMGLLIGAAVALSALGAWLAFPEGTPEAPRAATTSTAKTEDGSFVHKWDFREGPSADWKFEPERWSWSAGSGKGGGRMRATLNALSQIRVPLVFPHRPAVLTVQARLTKPANLKYSANAVWDPPGGLDCHVWRKKAPALTQDAGSYLIRFKITDRDIFAYFGETLTGIVEYETPYPADTITLHLKNWDLEFVAVEAMEASDADWLRTHAAELKEHMDQGPEPLR